MPEVKFCFLLSASASGRFPSESRGFTHFLFGKIACKKSNIIVVLQEISFERYRMAGWLSSIRSFFFSGGVKLKLSLTQARTPSPFTIAIAIALILQESVLAYYIVSRLAALPTLNPN